METSTTPTTPTTFATFATHPASKPALKLPSMINPGCLPPQKSTPVSIDKAGFREKLIEMLTSVDQGCYANLKMKVCGNIFIFSFIRGYDEEVSESFTVKDFSPDQKKSYTIDDMKPPAKKALDEFTTEDIGNLEKIFDGECEDVSSTDEDTEYVASTGSGSSVGSEASGASAASKEEPKFNIYRNIVPDFTLLDAMSKGRDVQVYSSGDVIKDELIRLSGGNQVFMNDLDVLFSFVAHLNGFKECPIAFRAPNVEGYSPMKTNFIKKGMLMIKYPKLEGFRHFLLQDAPYAAYSKKQIGFNANVREFINSCKKITTAESSVYLQLPISLEIKDRKLHITKSQTHKHVTLCAQRMRGGQGSFAMTLEYSGARLELGEGKSICVSRQPGMFFAGQERMSLHQCSIRDS